MEVWGHVPPENFESLCSKIAGNCISGLISNLIILLWLDRFNSKLTCDVRYHSKADAVQIKIRMPSLVSWDRFFSELLMQCFMQFIIKHFQGFP